MTVKVGCFLEIRSVLTNRSYSPEQYCKLHMDFDGRSWSRAAGYRQAGWQVLKLAAVAEQDTYNQAASKASELAGSAQDSTKKAADDAQKQGGQAYDKAAGQTKSAADSAKAKTSSY